jgi:putative two-component system response regulator
VRSRVAMLEQQSVAAELHDDATGEHCYRVGRMSSLLAADYGVDEHTCFLMDLAARMHDIGKLAVPDSILLKPGRLTAEERAIMETHATAGADLLAESKIPQMYVAEEIARYHHERFDGTGYPARLKGSMIPLAARIASLADVFDALTHARPYKHAWTVDDALHEIARLRGKHFDPELTDLFLALALRLRRQHADLDAFLGQEASHSPFIRARRELAAALKDQRVFSEIGR